MGAGEVDQISKIVQISQGITVTGLLLLIVWAFYTNRIKTRDSVAEEITTLKELHARELASSNDITTRERARGDRWEALSLDLLEKATLGVQTAAEAVGELSTQRRGRR